MSEMDKPRIKVDFNELLEPDLILLSKTNERIDSKGNKISLSEGVKVYLYEYNNYQDGVDEYLYADGIVVKNEIQENPVAIWCCRINENGIKVKAT